MATFFNDKKQTQEIKKFIKPHSQNKLANPKEKLTENKDKTLPIRGQ